MRNFWLLALLCTSGCSGVSAFRSTSEKSVDQSKAETGEQEAAPATSQSPAGGPSSGSESDLSETASTESAENAENSESVEGDVWAQIQETVVKSVSPDLCEKSSAWRVQKTENGSLIVGVGLHATCDKVEMKKFDDYESSTLNQVLVLQTLPLSELDSQQIAMSHGFSCLFSGLQSSSNGKTEFLWLFQNVNTEAVCSEKCKFVVSSGANFAGQTIEGTNKEKLSNTRCSLFGKVL